MIDTQMINDKDKKNLVVYCLLSLLFIYPLIQAGIYYRDDLDRSITGQYGWKSLGRPVADLLMRLLSASGKYNLDLFPYTMIASCLFLSLAAILLKKSLENKKIPHATFIACLIIFNPFMLQNIAYRYDSLGMALAFLLAVISYTYRSETASNKNRLIRIAAGILSLSIYQPCANIFIGLLAIDLAIYCTLNEKKPREKLHYFIKKITDFLAFYILYILFVAKFWKHTNQRAETVPIDISGLQIISHTFKELLAMVLSFFHGPVAMYFIIPSAIAFTITIYRICKNNKDIILNLALLALSFITLIVSLLGPNIILMTPPVFPRTLVSFSCYLVILAIMLGNLKGKIIYISIIPVITVFSFSAQLSNALKTQRDHENMVFNMITRDLLNTNKVDKITVIGQVNISERTKILLKNKPTINYFISPASGFTADFQLLSKGFAQTTYGYDDKKNTDTLQAINIKNKTTPWISNQEYKIYISGNNAVVQLGTP
ncbi:glucosyltransferase domain-containing protein [Erwinia aphidicola]